MGQDQHDKEFLAAMRAMGVCQGVKKTGNSSDSSKEDSFSSKGKELTWHEWADRHLPGGAEEQLDPEERDEFFKALEAMDMIPDKDANQGLIESAPSALRRLKRAKKHLTPDATLDLHGMNREQALQELQRFILKAFTQNIKSVIVITGKGLRSKDGKSVLKPAVERWIQTKGKRMIKEYSEAHFFHGGSGAFLIQLRQQ